MEIEQIDQLLSLMNQYFDERGEEYNAEIDSYKKRFPDQPITDTVRSLISRVIDRRSGYMYKLKSFVELNIQHGFHPVLSHQQITEMITNLNAFNSENPDIYRGQVLARIINLLEQMKQQTSETYNPYREKQEERKERYEELAKKNEALSNTMAESARRMSDVIPLGQPILSDHYSAPADRRFREKIHNAYQKAFEATEKSEYYEQRAKSVGRAGISSDDPEAVRLLVEKLANLEAQSKIYHDINSKIRKGQTANLTPEEIRIIKNNHSNLEPGRIPSYVLQHLNARIRSTKQRIEQLRQQEQRQEKTVAGNGYTYKEDVEMNRVMLIFNAIPPENVRELLKSNGFRWSPTNGAWMRQLNNAGIWAAKRVMEQLPGNTVEPEPQNIEPAVPQHTFQSIVNMILEYIRQHAPVPTVEIQSGIARYGINPSQVSDALMFLVKQMQIKGSPNGWVIYSNEPEYKPVFNEGNKQARLF